MKPGRMLFTAATAACLCVVSARGDWDLKDPAKWIQLPDETPAGIDVRWYDSAQMPPLLWLADDFLCTTPGPVTDIHLWGSWFGDNVAPTNVIGFNLSFWTDIPTNHEQGIFFSRPGVMLWQTNVLSTNLHMRPWTNVEPAEGWFDPLEQVWIPEADKGIWQFNFFFDPTNAFIQEGTPDKPQIYWLAVQAFLTQQPGARIAFGWKTARQHWNDDAVWSFPAMPPMWQELRYPLGHPLEGQSIDLAFVLTTTNEPEPQLDFGDAPAIYPVLLASNGARHVIGGPWFGDPAGGDPDNPDPEADGQPTATATGDDVAGLSPDDEDGIYTTRPFVAGQMNEIRVRTPTGGQVDLWIDLNGNGVWSAAENIFSGPMPAGDNQVLFPIPWGTPLGVKYVRGRIGSAALGPIPVAGPWPDGEVEDHQFQLIQARDYGDATDPTFPTLLTNNGAVHIIVSNVFLGATVDGEADGQPDGTATGDDNSPAWLPDDEDGILLPPRLIIGATQMFRAIASVPGTLFYWIDFNADGDWNDAGEALPPQPLLPGVNVIPLSTPPTAVPGGVMTRFRFTTGPGPIVYTGLVTDGEVEDYEIMITQADFGDAPPTFPVLLAATGAWHAVPSTPVVYLGNKIDTESDGLPSAAADGDDNSNLFDEDGVSILVPFVRGRTGTVAVVASTNANLYAWGDLNLNGSWDDPGENVISGAGVLPGTNFFNLPVAPTGPIGPTFVRFRLTTDVGVGLRGFASDGEVEDYQWYILQPGPAGKLVITNFVRAGTNLVYYWTSETNVVYQPQSATDLPPTLQAWSNLGGWVTGPANTAVDPNPPETNKFYRVVAPYTP